MTYLRYLLLPLALLFTAPVMAHMDMDHEVALGASAVFAPDGRLWVASVQNKHVRVRHSDDMGRTFSAPVIVNAKPEPISASGENRPRIALGPQGDIYVSWTGPLSKPWTGRIRFASSLDGGKHFSTPLTVHHNRDVITHRFDALAVDAKGRIVVAWIDKRDLEAAKANGKPYRGAAVYMAWSDDRGAHFTPEHKLADHSCECCRIAMAPTPDGGIGIFWRADYAGEIRDHAYAELKHGKVSMAPARATFTQWHIAGCPHQGPGLTIDDAGTRHAVWFSAAHGKPTIWYGQLDPGHPPQHLMPVATRGAAHADVGVNDQTVWVAWNQFAANGTQLMLRVSHDGGAHFDTAHAIAHTMGAAGSPQLLVHRQHAYVAWNTADGFHLVPVSASVQALAAADVPALLEPPAHGARVIGLWALDCVYCEANLQALDALHRQHPDIQVVTVATDSFATQRTAIAKRLGAASAAGLPAYAYAAATPARLNYLIDPSWGGATPRTLVIRADGSRSAASGQLTPQRLQQLLRP